MQTGLFNAALMYGIVKSYSSRSYFAKDIFYQLQNHCDFDSPKALVLCFLSELSSSAFLNFFETKNPN